MVYQMYEHEFSNGNKALVFVREDLKGKHREHCLCYNCNKFKPEKKRGHCKLAKKLFDFCVKNNMVTPVWECPAFDAKPTVNPLETMLPAASDAV